MFNIGAADIQDSCKDWNQPSHGGANSDLRVAHPPGPSGDSLSSGCERRSPGPGESALNFTAELDPRDWARYHTGPARIVFPPLFCSQLPCWIYCRVVALGYYAGLRTAVA
jgi:hypothetical protein